MSVLHMLEDHWGGGLHSACFFPQPHGVFFFTQLLPHMVFAHAGFVNLSLGFPSDHSHLIPILLFKKLVTLIQRSFHVVAGLLLFFNLIMRETVVQSSKKILTISELARWACSWNASVSRTALICFLI